MAISLQCMHAPKWPQDMHPWHQLSLKAQHLSEILCGQHLACVRAALDNAVMPLLGQIKFVSISCVVCSRLLMHH